MVLALWKEGGRLSSQRPGWGSATWIREQNFCLPSLAILASRAQHLAVDSAVDLVWKKVANFPFQTYSVANQYLFHLTLMLTFTEGTFGDWTETEGNFITLDLKIQSESSLFTVKIPSTANLYWVSQKKVHPQPKQHTLSLSIWHYNIAPHWGLKLHIIWMINWENSPKFHQKLTLAHFFCLFSPQIKFHLLQLLSQIVLKPVHVFCHRSVVPTEKHTAMDVSYKW